MAAFTTQIQRFNALIKQSRRDGLLPAIIHQGEVALTLRTLLMQITGALPAP